MALRLHSDSLPETGPPPDRLEALVAGIRGGDETALAALYDATSDRVFGLALRILRDRSAAEETTLDVFTQVWSQSDRHDPSRGSVLAWVLNLARSRAIDHLRFRSRRGQIEQAMDRGDDSLLDDSPSPESDSLAAERAERVRAALATLPADQRRAVEAAFYSGLSHAEVARALGEPLGTVKTRIRTGLRSLRASLASPEGSPA